MYKEVLQAIPNIETYPIIALVVFFSFFSALIVWFFIADKSRLDKVAMLPLEGDESIERNHPLK